MDKMTETDVIDQINEMLGGIEEITDMRSFKDAGLLTGNNGLIIKYDDGTEFQVTVVQSK